MWELCNYYDLHDDNFRKGLSGIYRYISREESKTLFVRLCDTAGGEHLNQSLNRSGDTCFHPFVKYVCVFDTTAEFLVGYYNLGSWRKYLACF